MSISRERPISYIGRDFDGLKQNLVKYARAHFSGAVSDMNETSPGALLIELMAYVGDVLGYYIDDCFNESNNRTARQLANVCNNAKQLGYRPAGPTPARGVEHIAIEVPATTNTYGELVPDDVYTPALLKGAKFGGPSGVVFESLDDVHFTASLGREVTGSRFNAATGAPTHFALRKHVDVIAAQTKTDTFTISEFKKFRTVELTDADVVEVLDVTDSDGEPWYEVDHLAQDWVFSQEANADVDSDVVPYSLKLVAAPRRFVVDRDITTGKATLVFGAGDAVNYDDDLVPNLAELALPIAGKSVFSAPALDPRNLVSVKSMGLSPYNTTLTVNYRVGGGEHTNVPRGSVGSVLQADFVFPTTTATPAALAARAAVEQSVGCTNLTMMDGGRAAETVQEIKNNASAYFAAQDRVVTREDFVARAMSMPVRFGRVEKAYVKRNPHSRSTVDLHVMTLDAEGHLSSASSTLKRNIQTYIGKYRMLTDGVNIMDCDVVNLRCSFGVVASSRANRSEVVARCIGALADRLATSRMQIGQAIVISELTSMLHGVAGVVSVYDVTLKGVAGTVDGRRYSDVSFDAGANTQDGILRCPANAIFEVKFPRRDISGAAK